MAKPAEIQLFMNGELENMFPRGEKNDNWVSMEGVDDVCESISATESSTQNSSNSVASSSLDLVEDGSSSASSSSSTLLSHANGPLYELSELMAQLPIKRGLSKFYHGKSQSYTSLASVKSKEDLAKKGTPYRPKMKSCKSCAAGLDAQSKLHSPKATITKKASNSRGSFLSSLGKRGSLVGSGCRPPLPAQNNF